jgi:hypothetical protein
MEVSRPGTNSHMAVSERCVELVNGETMATGTVPRFNTFLGLGSIATDNARPVCCA